MVNWFPVETLKDFVTVLRPWTGPQLAADGSDSCWVTFIHHLLIS